jgi:putative peptide zinc metalloprotease protein
VFKVNLTYETKIKLHPIQIREDRKNYIIEDKVTGEFFEMPAVSVQAIEMIVSGKGLLEIETKLKAVYPEEEIDLLEFARQLIDLELVEEIDRVAVEITGKGTGSSGFFWIPERVGRLFFNRFTMIVYLLLFVVNIGIFIKYPHLFPHYKDVFVFDVMVFTILTYMALTFIFVNIHEFGHVLALRSVGFPAKIEIGNRLFFVVLETDMAPVWRLDPGKRNRLYLAGICFDLVVLFFALMASIFADMPKIGIGIAGLVVFDVTMRLIYQCCIFMKNDLYYVFENLTGCYNLMENAQGFFKGLFFPKGRLGNQEIFAGEKPVVVSYGLFYLLGVGITYTLLVVYFIPQLVYMVKYSIPGFSLPVTNIHFWDAVVFFSQFLIGISLLFYSFRKNYRRNNL